MFAPCACVRERLGEGSYMFPRFARSYSELRITVVRGNEVISKVQLLEFCNIHQSTKNPERKGKRFSSISKMPFLTVSWQTVNSVAVNNLQA